MKLIHARLNAHRQALNDLRLADAAWELIQQAAPGTLPRDAAAACRHHRNVPVRNTPTKIKGDDES